MVKQRRSLLLTLLGALAIAGSMYLFSCSNSTTSTANPSGSMKMYVADDPSAFDSVVIVIVRVDVRFGDDDTTHGWTTVRSDSTMLDVLMYRNGARAVIDSTLLPPGHYKQIRLIVGEGSYVVVAGIKYPLAIPSGIKTGLKMNHEFDIVAGQTYEVVLDIDTKRSVHDEGSRKYHLDPKIRLVVVSTTGSIEGVVVPAAARTEVWTIVGSDTVSTDVDRESGRFELSGLPVNTYSVHCSPWDATYRDTILAGVAVVSRQHTEVGTVELPLR